MFLPECYEQLMMEVNSIAEEQVPMRPQLQSPEIRILLVSKYQSRAAIYSALDYFVQQLNKEPQKNLANFLPNLGENYVQNAQQRAAQLKQYYPTQYDKSPFQLKFCPKLEMIGPLQTNKAAKALRLFSVLHSISSIKQLQSLAKAWKNRETENSNSHLDIFFQYNASGEPQKNGCHNYDELRILADKLLGQNKLRLRGLMCMGYADTAASNNRKVFAVCRRLAEQLWSDYPAHQTGGKLIPNFELSMGMSRDYREALQEGANILRIGSLLFSD